MWPSLSGVSEESTRCFPSLLETISVFLGSEFSLVRGAIFVGLVEQLDRFGGGVSKTNRRNRIGDPG